MPSLKLKPSKTFCGSDSNAYSSLFPVSMRHLAQIQLNPVTDKQQLLILAHEQADGSWQVGDPLELDLESTTFPIGMLVIIHLNGENELSSINSATSWILETIQHCFAQNQIDSDFIRQEQAKIETWRQEITSQSQDLTRRQLEIETRREQLEELERKLASQDC